jgi:hypothetical protein
VAVIEGLGIDLNILADNILSQYNIVDIEEALSVVDFADYFNDPVGFCKDVLKQNLTDDVKRMLDSIVENTITVAVSANAVGKTHGAACASIWFKKCRPQAQVITATAPPSERNLKAKLWGEIRTQIKLNPEVFEGDKITSLYIEDATDPKSFIQGVTIPMSGSVDEREAKFSGIHAQNLLFVLDEGDAIPDEIYRAIESCMSGGFSRLLVMFNPKRRLGAVYRMIRDGNCATVYMRAFDHPNVISGAESILGAVTREQTVKRINEWTTPLHKGDERDGSCFDVPDFLVGAVAKDGRMNDYPPLTAGTRRIEEPQFAYMVLGEYPLLSAYQLINVEWIANARTRWDVYAAMYGNKPPVGVSPVVGLDAADLGEDYNTFCIRYGGWVKEIKRWHGMDIQQSAKRASVLYHEIECEEANVDATGVGAGIAPNMNLTFRLKCPVCGFVVTEPSSRDVKCKHKSDDGVTTESIMTAHYCNAKRIMVASKPTEKSEMGEFMSLRDQLWWSVREWLRADPGAMLPPNERLIEELTIPEYEIASGKVKVMDKNQMRKELGRSPDDADALCLTFAKGLARPRARVI